MMLPCYLTTIPYCYHLRGTSGPILFVTDSSYVVKGMKKFGLRMGVSHESLRFLLDGAELTGEEFAGGLDGAKILVERKDL